MHALEPIVTDEPPRDCLRCPRLVGFREQNRLAFPQWYNAPVPSFGSPLAEMLIVGLAPGLQGANRTGRPFTGDYAGVLLYKTLLAHGLAVGTYQADVNDGLSLQRCRITNAVRCVPPQNKPEPSEIATCAMYLAAVFETMPNLKVIVALGQIAFTSVLRCYGLKLSQNKFCHGALTRLPNGLKLFSSYHCSRYNTNTGRLTPEMFTTVIDRACTALDES